ncbi:MAG: protein kinase [Polyangiaceae bacterium]|nr:protein kinase [Polyangiaceae bacterium]
MSEFRNVAGYELHGSISTGKRSTTYIGRRRNLMGASRIVVGKSFDDGLRADPSFAISLREVANHVGAFEHRNLVRFIDFVQTNDDLMWVSEYVEGEALSRVVRSVRRKLTGIPLSICRAIVCDILAGLQAATNAHHAGQPLFLAHGCLSPDNVVVGSDGAAKLLNLGVSSVQWTYDGHQSLAVFSAPERFHSGPSASGDVYSVGGILWELACGGFANENPNRLRDPMSQNPTIPDSLAEVLVRALCVNLKGRYHSATQMSAAVRASGMVADAGDVGDFIREHAREALLERENTIADIENSAFPEALNPAGDQLLQFADSGGPESAPAMSLRSGTLNIGAPPAAHFSDFSPNPEPPSAPDSEPAPTTRRSIQIVDSEGRDFDHAPLSSSPPSSLDAGLPKAKSTSREGGLLLDTLDEPGVESSAPISFSEPSPSRGMSSTPPASLPMPDDLSALLDEEESGGVLKWILLLGVVGVVVLWWYTSR